MHIVLYLSSNFSILNCTLWWGGLLLIHEWNGVGVPCIRQSTYYFKVHQLPSISLPKKFSF